MKPRKEMAQDDCFQNILWLKDRSENTFQNPIIEQIEVPVITDLNVYLQTL